MAVNYISRTGKKGVILFLTKKSESFNEEYGVEEKI